MLEMHSPVRVRCSEFCMSSLHQASLETRRWKEMALSSQGTLLLTSLLRVAAEADAVASGIIAQATTCAFMLGLTALADNPDPFGRMSSAEAAGDSKVGVARVDSAGFIFTSSSFDHHTITNRDISKIEESST